MEQKAGNRNPGKGVKKGVSRKVLWLSLLCLTITVIVAGFSLKAYLYPTSMEAPEAARILAVQGKMPFQILIPGYLPSQFERAGVEISVNDTGPGREPMVQLAYKTSEDETLFVQEWVPINPEKEILASSRPIQTKWGRGWLLSEGNSLTALWVDVGPLRASIYTASTGLLSREKILALADSLGPASNRQVFSFVMDPPQIRDVPPPPPFEVPVNDHGIQELTLVVTPGGYSPLRIAVKKDIPVHLTFKQLGQVGCGNELFFPANPQTSTALFLKSSFDKKTLEFTPRVAGEFQFFCSHQMYRGILKVRG
jgi:hypothetical protein